MILTLLPLLAVVAPQAAQAPGPEHFSVLASYQAPRKPGGAAAVLVTFMPKDPDVQINEQPAPRLKLDPGQKTLVDKQPPPPTHVPPYDPENARYLDTMFPVSFPVALASDAPASRELVKADVVFFYCSKRDGWCRKGTAPVEFSVR